MPQSVLVVYVLHASRELSVDEERHSAMSRHLSNPLVRVANIAQSILVLRGQKVLLDSELAAIYDVTTKRLNEQVRRNARRFPEDFLFRLTRSEVQALNRSHFATGSQKHRDPRVPPFAFTEHGAIMAAAVLNSPRAVEMSVYIVRAFVKLREFIVSNRD